MSQPAATDQGVRSVSSTFHHFPWPKITQTYKIWWGRWEMWVYQGTKNQPWLVSLIASKSSQVISFRDGFPRDYIDNAVLKLANNEGLAAV